MTITTEDNIAGPYAGDGSTVAFATPHFQKNEDIRAILVTNSTGAETVQTLTTHYTLAGALVPAGGTLTMVTPPAIGETLYITVDPEQTQEAIIAASNATTQALDKLTQEVQALQLGVDRSLKVSESSRLAGAVNTALPATTDRANAALGFNASGDVELRFDGGPVLDASFTYSPTTHAGKYILLDVDSAAVVMTLPDVTTVPDGHNFTVYVNSSLNLASITVAVSGQMRSINGYSTHDEDADTVFIGLSTAEQKSHWVRVERVSTNWRVVGLLRENSGDNLSYGTGMGNGDMAAATYDPGGVADDAFARANHTGTQAISTITAGTANRLLGRDGSGNASEIIVGAGLNQASGTLKIKGDGPTFDTSKTYDPSADAGLFTFFDTTSNDVVLTLPDTGTVPESTQFWVRVNSSSFEASITVATTGQLRSANGYASHNHLSDTVYIGYSQASAPSDWAFVYERNGLWFVHGLIRQNSGDSLALVEVGTAANQLVQLDGSARLPAVDASQLTNLPGGGGGDVVSDTTPQLGGDLDVNGQSIVSVSNGNIPIAPNGTGAVVLDGLSWPTADGTSGHFLRTDGAGNLSFAAAPGAGSGSGRYADYIVPSGTTGADFTAAVIAADAAGVGVYLPENSYDWTDLANETALTGTTLLHVIGDGADKTLIEIGGGNRTTGNRRIQIRRPFRIEDCEFHDGSVVFTLEDNTTAISEVSLLRCHGNNIGVLLHHELPSAPNAGFSLGVVRVHDCRMETVRDGVHMRLGQGGANQNVPVDRVEFLRNEVIDWQRYGLTADYDNPPTGANWPTDGIGIARGNVVRDAITSTGNGFAINMSACEGFIYDGNHITNNSRGGSGFDHEALYTKSRWGVMCNNVIVNSGQNDFQAMIGLKGQDSSNPTDLGPVVVCNNTIFQDQTDTDSVFWVQRSNVTICNNRVVCTPEQYVFAGQSADTYRNVVIRGNDIEINGTATNPGMQFFGDLRNWVLEGNTWRINLGTTTCQVIRVVTDNAVAGRIIDNPLIKNETFINLNTGGTVTAIRLEKRVGDLIDPTIAGCHFVDIDEALDIITNAPTGTTRLAHCTHAGTTPTTSAGPGTITATSNTF